MLMPSWVDHSSILEHTTQAGKQETDSERREKPIGCQASDRADWHGACWPPELRPVVERAAGR
jgi:hypothetical protein